MQANGQRQNHNTPGEIEHLQPVDRWAKDRHLEDDPCDKREADHEMAPLRPRSTTESTEDHERREHPVDQGERPASEYHRTEWQAVGCAPEIESPGDEAKCTPERSDGEQRLEQQQNSFDPGTGVPCPGWAVSARRECCLHDVIVRCCPERGQSRRSQHEETDPRSASRDERAAPWLHPRTCLRKHDSKVPTTDSPRLLDPTQVRSEDAAAAGIPSLISVPERIRALPEIWP